ncbi:hypothetical protein EVAR_69548_1 [Eumeta japonica]|uniref:Uncharacterized protein n=1 Tax=Eumeta variegata TaxID=151549 RepID=A0A4C2A7N6_EUMVA|nr:hypothetical protein EVAR_69548_1 [Eumeta japonica]
MNRNRLHTLKRGFAQKICKSYRTVSFNAALALSGLFPLDLRMQEAVALYKHKKKTSRKTASRRDESSKRGSQVSVLSDSKSSFELLMDTKAGYLLVKFIRENIWEIRTEGRQIPLSYIKKKIRDESVLKWQDRYQLSSTGEVTRRFFTNVEKAFRVVRSSRLTPTQARLLLSYLKGTVSGEAIILRTVIVGTVSVLFEIGEVVNQLGCIKASEVHEVVVYEDRGENLKYLLQCDPTDAVAHKEKFKSQGRIRAFLGALGKAVKSLPGAKSLQRASASEEKRKKPKVLIDPKTAPTRDQKQKVDSSAPVPWSLPDARGFTLEEGILEMAKAVTRSKPSGHTREDWVVPDIT